MRSLGFKAILIGFWEMMDLALGNYFYVRIAKIINNEGMRLIRCKVDRLRCIQELEVIETYLHMDICMYVYII